MSAPTTTYASSQKFWTYRVLNVIFCLFAILISLYAYYVETEKERDKNYKALCDFNNSFSCSKVLTSRYGRGFGVLEYATGKDHWLNQPNSVFGVIFYTMFMIIGESRKLSVSNLQVYMAISSNFMSIYLACILFFILEDFCIVCVATYVINFVLLLLAFKKLYLVRDKFVVHTKQVQKKTL